MNSRSCRKSRIERLTRTPAKKVEPSYKIRVLAEKVVSNDYHGFELKSAEMN